MKTFDQWGPNFKISFEVYLNKEPTDNKWYNVYWMTATGVNSLGPGDRVSGFWFHREGGKWQFQYDTGNSYNVRMQVMGDMETGRWHKVEIEQKKTSENSAKYTFSLNGEVKKSANVNLKTYRNVKYYQSMPGRDAMGDRATLRALVIEPGL